MTNIQRYDAAVVGGGLAGLGLAIQLARKGHAVILFEKERYPFHKVCGEYISYESWDYLKQLGIPLDKLDLPFIDKLILTAPNGTTFRTKLPLGGFGISRYLLDDRLATIARQEGVMLFEEARVDEVYPEGDYRVSYTQKGIRASIRARLVFGSFGKRSNLDLKWQRSFVQQKPSAINNFVGIKYHIRTEWDEATIGLHNFPDGYCGISKVEDNKYCLCYLTTAGNLNKAGKSIEQLEAAILSRNKHLKNILTHSERDPGFPVTISQISFDRKTQSEHDVLMLGDAAGMITPLCGNGMSMALYSSKLASDLAAVFFQGGISFEQLKSSYQQQWQRQFASRLQTGRTLQRFFGAGWLSNLFVGTFSVFPFLARPLIKQTHGQPF